MSYLRVVKETIVSSDNLETLADRLSQQGSSLDTDTLEVAAQILENAAKQRVMEDRDLAKAKNFILADWDEGSKHQIWVCFADKEELLEWADANKEGWV